MQIYDIIAQAQGGQAIANLADAAGISEAQADAVVRAVLPALAAGIERNTLSRGGLADLVAALGQGQREAILEQPEAFNDPRVVEDGQGILGHILGAPSKTRSLSLQAARATGISDSIIQMLLPILAQLLMGAISRWLKGGLGDVMSRLPGGNGEGGGPERRQAPSRPMPRGGGGFELPRAEVPQGGFPMPPIPGSDDTGPMEDMRPAPRRGGGTGFELPQAEAPQGRYPMPPIPGAPEVDPRAADPSAGGGNNPYGDLSDILRRGGGDAGGRSLGGLVRDTLGGALGFRSKGILGWIIKAVVLRYGWSLLKRIIGGVLRGR